VGPYRTALCFSRRGTYVSRTYVIVLAKPQTSTAESTHEEKSNEHNERPNSNDMVSPPPVKVLESRRSTYVQLWMGGRHSNRPN